MSTLADHLVALPIVLPLVAGAALVLMSDRRSRLTAVVSVASTVALLGIALRLLRLADTGSAIAVYRVGDWPPPLGIVLVVDRLSALMLVLTGIVAVAALVFATARWHRAAPHFHSLFLFLLAGLNGVFLTGDLFNLFVFFEVLLAASYGLLLHGSGPERVKAGIHYIAINFAGSMLLLVGISLIYGVTGTLHMADLAVRIAELAPGDRALAEAAAGIVGIAFLVKAGAWPLCFWLPTTYAAATAPAAAIFAILSKVGVYAILRLWLLVFGRESGASAGFGGDWLLYTGILTILFGVIGILGSRELGRLAGFSVLVSSGTLLAVIGTGNGAAIGGSLFYLVSSTLAIAAFFLLIELIQRSRDPRGDTFLAAMEPLGGDGDTEPEEEIGLPIPGTVAILGLAFVGCALVLSGLPPLPGFIAKFAILTALLNPAGAGSSAPSPTTWIVVALLVLAGLAVLVAMTRAGIRALWLRFADELPRFSEVEIGSIALLLALCLGMTIQGGPVIRYMDATARSLLAPESYPGSAPSPPGAASSTEGSAP